MAKIWTKVKCHIFYGVQSFNYLCLPRVLLSSHLISKFIVCWGVKELDQFDWTAINKTMWNAWHSNFFSTCAQKTEEHMLKAKTHYCDPTRLCRRPGSATRVCDPGRRQSLVGSPTCLVWSPTFPAFFGSQTWSVQSRHVRIFLSGRRQVWSGCSSGI